MKITLDGIYDTVLSGFQCMRGYAPLKDLAALSVPNPAFQRNLIDTHRAEIERFMNDGQYLFFPEVILACPLRYEFDSNGNDSGMNPMRMIQGKEAFTSNVNDLQIKFRSDNKEKLQRVSLTLDNEVDSGFLLSRIDGNHRISAFDINPDTYGKMRVPFCIIFLPDDDDRVEKVIFNNINFKQIPLRPEHSLKVILDTFSDRELQEERFGWPYWYTKKLLECIEDGFFLNTSFLIKNGDNHHDECRTTLFKLCELLAQEGILPNEESGFANIRKALQSVDINLEGHKVSQGLLIAAVFMILKDSDRFPEFLKWVTTNALDNIAEIAPKTLIDIFYKVTDECIFIILAISALYFICNFGELSISIFFI